MSVKVVYALVFEEKSCFYEMFLLSLHSLRLREPDRQVEVVLDTDSYDRILEKKEPLLESVKLTRVAVPSSYDGTGKSRYLKTGLRSIVDGDFLYIDNDTIVCDSIADIDNFDADIAAVANENGPLTVKSKSLEEQCLKAGFRGLDRAPFYNGGVFLVRDTGISREFFGTWRRRWAQSLDNGVAFDQPALCQANLDLGCPLCELPGEWNCQICSVVGPHYLKKAKILHYYGSISVFSKEIINPHIKQTSGIDAFAEEFARNPREGGFERYHPTHIGKLKSLASDLLSHFTGRPVLFRLLEKAAFGLARPTTLLVGNISRR